MAQQLIVFITVAVVFTTCFAEKAQIVVHKNENLYVNYGRSVFIRPNVDLSLLYKPDGNCRVYVLKDEPTHYKVGGLYPGIFPCNFDDKQVRYQHFGGLDTLEDIIKMQARLDTGTQTVVQPFSIHVFVLINVPSEVLEKKVDLMVEDVGGLSEPISNEVLQFNFNEDRENCFVRLVDAVHGPPFYGRLVNVTPALSNPADKELRRNMACKKFTDGSLRYIHKKTLSSNRDYIPLIVEISDKTSNEVAQREFIRMPVRIKRAPQNERPSQSFKALFSAQVDQSMITAITPEVLAVEDKETDPDMLILNVTRPFGPGEGKLINTDNPNLPVTTFYQKDIRDYKIAYKPPDDASKLSRHRQIWFEAIDGEGARSVPFYVFIIAKEMNSRMPKVRKNTGLTMFEGQTRSLDKDVLEIVTKTDPNKVKIEVIGGMKHGQLEKFGKSTKVVTLKDINQGTVRYIHDDSNTYHDNFVIRIKDGKFIVDVLITVTIIPKDDEPPKLKHNLGLTLLEGGTGNIDQFLLSAVDVDSDETKLIYKVVDPPLAGGLCYRQKNSPDRDEVGWKKVNSFYSKNITEFSQADIILGRVYYKHFGSEIFSDRFTFRVSDNFDIPNQSGLKTFVIDIKKIDDLRPKLYPKCPLQMKALETVMAMFNKINLRYSDDDTEDDKLRYRIVKKPYFVDGAAPSDAGRIVVEKSGLETEVSSFTQKQVNHFKVSYDPPKKEIGRSRREVKFEYEVEDTAGNRIDKQVFKIDLQPKNNKAPVGVIKTVPVDERRSVIISKDYFNVEDNDNSAQDISVGIMKEPQFGALINQGRKMLPGDVLPLQEILSNNLVYSHDGSETKGEKLEFLINDGFHSVPVILPIVVTPIDDQPPKVKYLAKKVIVLERGIKTLTKDMISGTDEDTDDELLTFLVVSGPNHGVIQKQGLTTNVFTQRDISDGTVAYKHTAGEIGLKSKMDTVNLTLSDRSDDWIVGGNRYSGIILNFVIQPVDSEPPQLTVGTPVTVGEGLKKALASDNLLVTDVDTERLKIMCTITQQPEHGYVESITPAEGSEKSRVGMRADKFSNRDLINGKVNYVQSHHKEVEPTVDQFIVTCSDKNNTSPKTTINVLIQPRNDEKPIPLVRQFVTLENDYVPFDIALLNAIDPDVPEDDIVFYVSEKPKHGDLFIQGDDFLPLTKFTKQQLLGSEGGLLYQHDGSETKKDSFKLIVSDGVHNVTTIVPVTIIPVDDEVPHVITNTGLRIDRGEIKAITNRNLKANDLDSDDKGLVYLVMSDAQLGMLRKRSSVGRYTNLTKGSNFTQDDVDNKRVFYQHWNKGNGERDVIRLDVTDGFNRLINQQFYIIIAPIDNVHPDVINKGVVLKEGDRITLTTDLLSASDVNSKDEKLVFYVNKVPAKGYLENTDYPSVPITSFKQIDLAGNKIVYVHTSPDEVKFDSFEFSVSDGVNKIDRAFRITLTDVDNKKPVLHISVLAAFEGKNTIITPFELRADDKDTKPENLVFSITHLPLHGQIVKDGYQIVSTFTQKEINDNRISYRHDGSEVATDSFTVTVTDGTHSEFFVFPDSSSATTKSQTVPVKIRPIDNKLPVLAKNLGASSLRHFSDGSSGFQFSDQSVQGHDSDSKNEKLQFVVTTPAKHGKLVNVSSPKEVLKSFFQSDVNNGNVRYILNDGENATSDMFVFKLIDEGGNTLHGQQFYFNWAWVEFSQPEFNVSETDSYVKITLRRRGFLGETSFVSLLMQNETAVEYEDFELRGSNQVQFSPGQTKAYLRLKILDDTEYEDKETFMVLLGGSIHTLIGPQGNSSVHILDKEDEPVVIIQQSEYLVEEGIGTLKVPLRRLGDLKPLIKVLCVTVPGTARGTLGSTVTSYRDYISKFAEDRDNIITFDTNEAVKSCPVKIIDDSLFEKDEKFHVKLLPYLGASIGKKFSNAEIIILEDDNDVPRFTLDKSQYDVDEDAGTLKVTVHRKGSDLSIDSSILLATRQWSPVSARAERDYVPQVQSLQFAPGETEKTIHIIILDDIARPRIEGRENFTVLLSAPLNATLGEYSMGTVSIDDTYSDLPTVYFEKPEYMVRENDSVATAFIKRRGDIRHTTSVRCYTRQDTATVGKDYIERPDTNASFVVFKPKETKKKCQVSIINDTMKEPEEKFRLHLGKVFSTNEGGGKHGGRNMTVVKIKDNDQPVIKFMRTKYYVKEPAADLKSKFIEIPIKRSGDPSQLSSVMVYTKDGSARSGIHYEPLAKEVTFGINVTEQKIRVKIFHEQEKSLRRAFSVYIKPDKKRIAELGLKKTIVYIEEVGRRTGVTFPLKPRVVSLRDYDDLRKARAQPVQGYPLICVTSCNPKFPSYSSTSGICKSERIKNELTRYRWQIAARDSQDGVTYQFSNVDSKTFVTNTNRITLDSIYFGPGTRVRCVAQAVDEDEGYGVESFSDPVTVDPNEGLCMPRNARDIGAETFSAQVQYTGLKDPLHPNLIRVRVLVPHFDGLMPAISTKLLSNFEIALSPDASRIAQHTCSNLLDFNEVRTRFGFIKNQIIDPDLAGESQPYQYDVGLRGNNTLRFYRNLNLDACLWTFESYYDMTELVQRCGGTITTDGQVKDVVQSHLSIKVPLFVSYIYHSPTAAGGWMHFDHKSSLRLTFVYDTAVLWKDGVGPPATSTLKGNLYPTSIRIRDSDRKLVVNFRTKARFRGQFIMKSDSSPTESLVMSPDQPSLSMTLKLIRSDATYSEPEQMWQFVSNFAIRDYSGQYIVRLVPCTVTEDIEYSTPLECTPRNPITFKLPIRFQQTSEPVEANFSLNTRFFLLNREQQWLSNKFTGSEATDVAFTKGSSIFGRVMIDTAQSLGNAYHVVIEKVFLCSGLDGYIPKFEPASNDFGCLADSTNLLYRFKILDRLAPSTVTSHFDNVKFNAVFAADDPTAEGLVTNPGADGFKLDSTPLFKVSGGRNWFLHTIYTVRSEAQKNRGLGKRSIEYQFNSVEQHALITASDADRANRIRRSKDDINGIGKTKGTNIQMIRLVYRRDVEDVSGDKGKKLLGTDGKFSDANGRNGQLPKESSSRSNSRTKRGLSSGSIAGIVLAVIFALILLGAVIIYKRRKPAEEVKRSASNVSVGGEEGTEI